MATKTGSVNVDAEIVSPYLSANAIILGDRWRHDRVEDHFGSDSDLYIALSEAIGPYPAWTPIHYVLVDLMDRLLSLEGANRMFGSFTIDALLDGGTFTADAAVKRFGMSATFTADARFAIGGSFTVGAWIKTAFDIDAFIIL